MVSAELIVFTDLDGTLLDHATYSFVPALPALTLLRDLDIPVVLASSKTAAEMVSLRAELDLQRMPMICENGAGLVKAGEDPDDTEGDYADIRVALDRLSPDLRQSFEGFGDMTPERIAEVTGLPVDHARRAGLRHWSEPGLWAGDDPEPFIDALSRLGIHARSGGRFLTLSRGWTKADRMDAIAARYGSPPIVALGDAPNDREMLEHADYGIIIPNPSGHNLPAMKSEADGRIRRATRPGPEGWNLSIHALLSELGIGPENKGA